MMEHGYRRIGDPVRPDDTALENVGSVPGHDESGLSDVLRDLDEVLNDTEYPKIVKGFGETLVDDKERAAAEALTVLLKEKDNEI